MTSLQWFSGTWHMKIDTDRGSYFNSLLLLIVLLSGMLFPSMFNILLPLQFALPAKNNYQFITHVAATAAIKQTRSIASIHNDLLHPLFPMKKSFFNPRGNDESSRPLGSAFSKEQSISLKSTLAENSLLRKRFTHFKSAFPPCNWSGANKNSPLSEDPYSYRHRAAKSIEKIQGFLFPNKHESFKPSIVSIEAIHFVNCSILNKNIIKDLQKISNFTHLVIPRETLNAKQKSDFNDTEQSKLSVNDSFYRNNPQLQVFLDKINEWYQKHGYVFSKVLPHPILIFSKDQQKISLHFHVLEPKVSLKPVKLHFYRSQSSASSSWISRLFSPKHDLSLSTNKKFSGTPQSFSPKPLSSHLFIKEAVKNEPYQQEQNESRSFHKNVNLKHTPSLHTTFSLLRNNDSLLPTKGKTRPSTIAKHLQLIAGQPFRWSERRWNELLFSGIFSDAQASVVILPDSSIQMHIFVVERPSFKFEPGISKGFSSTNDLALEMALVDQNFFGTGTTLTSELKHTAFFSSESVFGTHIRLLNNRLSLLTGSTFCYDFSREYNYQTGESSASTSSPGSQFAPPSFSYDLPSSARAYLTKNERRPSMDIFKNVFLPSRGLLWTGMVGSWIRTISFPRFIPSPLLCVFNASFIRRQTIDPSQGWMDRTSLHDVSALPSSRCVILSQNGERRCVPAAALLSSFYDHDCSKLEAIFQIQKLALVTHARLSWAFGVFTKRDKMGENYFRTSTQIDNSKHTPRNLIKTIQQHLNQINKECQEFVSSLIDVQTDGKSMLFSTMKCQVGLRIYFRALKELTTLFQKAESSASPSPEHSKPSQLAPLSVAGKRNVMEYFKWFTSFHRFKKRKPHIDNTTSSYVSDSAINFKNPSSKIPCLKQSKNLLQWKQSYVESIINLRVRNFSLWMLLMALKTLPSSSLRTVCNSIILQTNKFAGKGFPHAEKLFLGGPKSLRGFAIRQLGPYEAVLSCSNDIWLPIQLKRLNFFPSLPVEVGVVADYSIGFIRSFHPSSYIFTPSNAESGSVNLNDIAKVGNSSLTLKDSPFASDSETFKENAGNNKCSGALSFWSSGYWKTASSLGFGLKLGRMGLFLVHPLGKEIKLSLLKFNLYLL